MSARVFHCGKQTDPRAIKELANFEYGVQVISHIHRSSQTFHDIIFVLLAKDWVDLIVDGWIVEKEGPENNYNEVRVRQSNSK